MNSELRRDFAQLHEIVRNDGPRKQIGGNLQSAEQEIGAIDVEPLGHVVGPVPSIDIGDNV